MNPTVHPSQHTFKTHYGKAIHDCCMTSPLEHTLKQVPPVCSDYGSDVFQNIMENQETFPWKYI